MTFTPRKVIGCGLILFGVFIALFSSTLASPVLERCVGITALVGAENVVYTPDGSYYFTHPRALQRWVIAVAGLGISIALAGLLVFLPRQQR